MSLLDTANRIPPCVCRLLARSSNGHRGLSTRQIADRSGIPKSTVQDWSRRTNWAGIDMGRADAFAKACGVDLAHPAQAISAVRGKVPYHITAARGNQRLLYAKLVKVKLVPLSESRSVA